MGLGMRWTPPKEWGIRIGPPLRPATSLPWRKLLKWSFVAWLAYEVGTFLLFYLGVLLVRAWK